MFFFCSLNHATSEVYQITTNLTDLCTNCLSLSLFATNLSRYLHSNSTLVFLPGTHHLTVNLTLSNMETLSINSESMAAQIVCTHESHFLFSNSQSICITNLEFIGCGGNRVENVEDFVVQNTKFKGQENSGTALELIKVRVHIVNCTFTFNKRGIYKNLKFAGLDKNGLVGGALVANHSKVNVSHSTFEGNGAKFGGAIFTEHSIINIKNSTFRTNTASCCGGVICSVTSNITTETSEFNNNGETLKGGTVFSESSNVKMRKSKFSNNDATYGGVLSCIRSNITIELSVFEGNIGHKTGGVVRCLRGTITIKESEFADNIAANGGTLASSSDTIAIESSQFDNNTATKLGGVLYSYSSKISIETSEFSNNVATQDGGVHYSHTGRTRIAQSKFDNNTAFHDGGVVYSDSTYIRIETSEFDHNAATMWGGVLKVSHGIISIRTSKFDANTAKEGGVLQSYIAYITINGSEFTNNCANKKGGALDASIGTLTIIASNFNSNTAGVWAGALGSSSITKIEASTFKNNKASSGGALYSTRDHLTISSCEFDNNNATSGGVLTSSTSTVTIQGSKFGYNTAYSEGGVLCSFWSNVTIQQSQFNDNTGHMGGALYTWESNSTIKDSKFDKHTGSGGGVLCSKFSTIRIEASEFSNSSAIGEGGVLSSTNSNVTIEGSKFDNSIANSGGVLYSYSFHSSSYTVIITTSSFIHNTARRYGGVLEAFSDGTVTIQASKFNGNTAIDSGGVLDSSHNRISIENCKFNDNTAAENGGVLSSSTDNMTIEATVFDRNGAPYGGVLYFLNSNITIGDSNFTRNNSTIGAVIYATSGSIVKYSNALVLANNSASKYAVMYIAESEFSGHDLGNVIFSSNLGSLMTISSNITLAGYYSFINNEPPHTTANKVKEGGAITLFLSNAFFDGICSLEYNNAENGGAILAAESKLYIKGNLSAAHNVATRNGGGVHLLNSELNCQQRSNILLTRNNASGKGGGLHAISSSIKVISAKMAILSYQRLSYRYTGSIINFTNNKAERGGGLSLEANAKFYVLKLDFISIRHKIGINTASFTANTANYGGAVYVDDDTNSGTCTGMPNTECFLQALAIYEKKSSSPTIQSIILYFSQNQANISGSILYGGLLDRCAVSQFAEIHIDTEYKGNGVTYFRNLSNISGVFNTTRPQISSHPVRVCFCINNKHNCTHKIHIKTKKGDMFAISLTAVDQIGQPVNAIIQSSLTFTESGLAEGQLIREIPGECTDLTFNVVSPHNSEYLYLYASDGPCKDAGVSKMTVEIHFLPCSCLVGLQISGVNETNCTCDCHSDIDQYVEQCDSKTGSFIKSPRLRTWISYINDSGVTGYLLYPNCPFDYCLSNSPPVDLNQPNGADVQCAYNRSSLFCGSCQPGLSLSLGSSHCLPCPSYWPALLLAITIAAVLAGIALVAILLILNMTVAVGTLNGLIFFANVVHVNRSILYPYPKTNFITILVSWLNLEIGIDICYFPGMDTYIKTWLQLVFPSYVIFLVVLIIMISSHSTRFSKLIGKKNPVATLATLILLSYAKLLEICFRSLSIGVLKYPDGSSEMLWLPDATVRYLSGKHIPLFIVTIFVLLVGLIYTALLFSWQWLLYLPRWKIFRWSRHPKVQTLIETYNTPYTPKHRYWTGLLLIVRAALYLVAAVNVSNDPSIALTAITFTICCILLLSRFIGGRLYKKWLIDGLETFFYFNIVFFVIFIWYSLGNTNPGGSRGEAVAYTSIIITFIVLLLIILYHVYAYTTVFSKVKKSKLGNMIGRLLTKIDSEQKPKCHCRLPPDNDIHRFNEILDMIDRPVDTNDYRVPLNQERGKPTQSVVEVHQPHLVPPDHHPEEATPQRATDTAEVVPVEPLSPAK